MSVDSGAARFSNEIAWSLKKLILIALEPKETRWKPTSVVECVPQRVHDRRIAPAVPDNRQALSAARIYQNLTHCAVLFPQFLSGILEMLRLIVAVKFGVDRPAVLVPSLRQLCGISEIGGDELSRATQHLRRRIFDRSIKISCPDCPARRC